MSHRHSSTTCELNTKALLGVQGALFAAKGLAQGSGPLMFSALFTFFTTNTHFFPEAPIIGLAVVMCFGAVVACTVRVPPVGHSANDVADEEPKDEVLMHTDGFMRICSDNRARGCLLEQETVHPLLEPENDV